MIVGDAVKSATLLIGSLDSRNIPMQIMHSPVIRSSCCVFFATFSTSSFGHSSCEPRRNRVILAEIENLTLHRKPSSAATRNDRPTSGLF